jgi:hypothetical protein
MNTFLPNSKIFTVIFFIANMFLANGILGQTVTLDQADLDYAPGETVYITGTGWQPGETVTLQVDNLTDPDVDCGVVDPEPHELWTTVADGAGNFMASWYVNDCELGADLLLGAFGVSSGFTYEIFFTDGNHIGFVSAVVNGAPVSICTGSSASLGLTVTTCSASGPSNSTYSATYLWEQSANNNTWSTATGTSTNDTYSASPTSNTYYRCKITVTSASKGCSTSEVYGGATYTTVSALITVNPLPAIYNVTYTGSLCDNITITLSGSETGVDYKLKRGSNTVETIVGEGTSLEFSPVSQTGTYTVVATISTTCSITMNGSVVLTGGSPPTVYNVTGGGTFCTGGAGVPVGVDNSQNNVNYQLYRDATPVGSPVAGSNGNAISFGNQTVAGTYTVIATNNSGCTSEMTGSVDVTIYEVFTSGVINTTGETICYGGGPALIGSATAASGGDGSIVYEWRADGTPIASSNSATYNPPSGLTATTVYTRYAKDGTCNTTFTVSTGSWIVTVRPAFTSGAINTTGETICYGGDPVLIGSATAASGGDQTITYKWQSSLLGDFTDAIDIGSSDVATYDPPAGLTTTRTYRRLAHDETCNTDFEIATGEWMVTINPLLTLSTAAQEEALCPGKGAVINLTGLLPSTTNSITYNIDGGSDYTATGVVADGSGNGSFTTINLNYEVHDGKTLTITSITITSNNPNCSQSFTEEVVLDILVPTIISSITPTKTSWTYGCESTTLTATAAGDGILTYQWYHKYNGGSTESIGTNSSIYQVPELANAGTHEYWVVVSAGCPPDVTSAHVTITINSQVAGSVNDGEAYYTGPTAAFTPSSTSSTATVTLSAFIKNRNGSVYQCGDIATARISFDFRIAGVTLWTKVSNGQDLLVGYVDPSYPSKGGTAAVIAQLNLGNGTSEVFEIRVRISGNYKGDPILSCGTLTVTKPQQGGTICGGAKLTNANSTGFVKGANKTQIGFFVNYTMKSGKAQNPKGKVSMIVKSYNDQSGNTTLSPHYYKITSNAIASLIVNAASGTFTGKANIAEIFNYGASDEYLSSIEGNCIMVLDLEDKVCGNNTEDLVGITVYRNSGGIWYSNNWGNTGKTVPTTIYCGDVYVSSSSITCATTSLTAKTATNETSSSKTTIVEIQTEQSAIFNVMVYPNPSIDQFTVVVEGSSTENVTVAVFDVLGRLLKTIEKKDGEAIQFGEDFPTGSYIAKISQGAESKTVQLIKK